MKKTLLIIGAIVVAVVIIVVSINSVNQKESNRIANKERTRQINIDYCINDAYETYRSDWNSGCRIEGKADDCYLPNWRATDLDQQYEDDKDRCIERYAK